MIFLCIFQTIDIPDGHRAPVPAIHGSTRSIDTQTPSSPSRNCGTSRDGHSSESPASPCIRPYSISPSVPIIPCCMENSPRPSSSYDSPLGSTLGNKSDKDGMKFFGFFCFCFIYNVYIWTYLIFHCSLSKQNVENGMILV